MAGGGGLGGVVGGNKSITSVVKESQHLHPEGRGRRLLQPGKGKIKPFSLRKDEECAGRRTIAEGWRGALGGSNLRPRDTGPPRTDAGSGHQADSHKLRTLRI